MPVYEYRTVAAPRKGEKAKGIKTPEGRIAQAMQSVLNAQASEGWDYIRSDLMPMEARSGLTTKAVNYHTVLTFRRVVEIADISASAVEEVRDTGATGAADFGVYHDEADVSDHTSSEEITRDAT